MRGQDHTMTYVNIFQYASTFVQSLLKYKELFANFQYNFNRGSGTCLQPFGSVIWLWSFCSRLFDLSAGSGLSALALYDLRWTARGPI